MIKKTIALTVSAVLILSILAAPGLALAESGLTVLENSADPEFPYKLDFTLSAESSADITDIRLHYRVDRESYVQVTSEVYIEFTPDTTVDVQWEWDMRKTGGMPPGSTLEYWWTLKDADGAIIKTAPVNVLYDDTRHDWQILHEGQITMYWYEGGRAFAEELMAAAQAGLSLLRNDIGAYLSKPVDIYIYANAEDLQNAMIFPQTWTGGVAYPSYGTIAIGIKPDYLSWGLRTIVHELTHLVIHQMTDNPYLDIPVWLDEGLAMNMEGPLEDVFLYYLGKAIEEDTLISVQTLSSPFSAYADKSYLSYAQSFSLVNFLIGAFGKEKMLELLIVFSEGSSYDNAFIKVYGVDIDGLDKMWNDYIDYILEQQSEESAGTSPSSVVGVFLKEAGGRDG